MKCHMNHSVNKIILGGEVAFYLEMLNLPARAAAPCQPDWWGVWRPHKFYVGVCVKLGCCCGATLQEAAPRRLFKAGIWFAGRLNLALPGLNLGHWVSGTHCDWHTGAQTRCTCCVVIYICIHWLNIMVMPVAGLEFNTSDTWRNTVFSKILFWRCYMSESM